MNIWQKLFFLIMACFVACHPKSRTQGERLRYNLQTEPPSLDWSITTDNASIEVLNNLMEGLTRYDENLKPVPALAESWGVLDDGRRYIFHLRKNARWSDGKPVLADDFVYSWQRLIKPETAAEYAYFIYLVKNAREINSGEVKDVNQLGIRALDARTLEVELKEPAVYFPVITTFVVTYPQRKDLVERYPESWTEPEHLVTTGPFVLTKWQHEYKLIIEPNPYYWDKQPRVKQVIFYMVNERTTELALYDTGDLDICQLPPQAIPSYRKSRDYHYRPILGTYYVGFNIEKPPVNNPLVRRALAMAIDRSKIPEILKGDQEPATSFIPPGISGHNPELGFKFNPERAREILAQAGYPGGKGLPPITLAFNTMDSNQLVCEFVQAQWQNNLGVTVYLRNMEWKVFLKELQLDPPAVFRLGWYADYPDPDNFATIFLSDSGNNHTRFKSKEYDELVSRASFEKDPQKRQQLYDQAQKMILEEHCIFVPLYFYTVNYMIQPYVRNLDYNPMGQLFFKDAWLDFGVKTK